MTGWFNKLMSRYFRLRNFRIQQWRKHPHQVQQRILNRLLNKAEKTEVGRRYTFGSVRNSEDYRSAVPVIDYEVVKADIERMMHGEKDVLWPGQVKWFSKSSGTTSDKSKFIPVPEENLKNCHLRASWDTATLLYLMDPDTQMFAEKNLVMGGSLSTFAPFPETRYGDVSAIMLHHMPKVARPFYTPDFETALLSDWEEKIEKMAMICSRQNVTLFGGVPTWTIVLFKRILELTGCSNIKEVWPNVRAYMHGGVGFEPYRETFKAFVPDDKFIYQQIYNASEGYFAAQDIPDQDDMLLLLDNNVYYEFVPEAEMHGDEPEAIPLSSVETGKTYALVISTNGGLWRYMPGDTIRFTATEPYRIEVMGRTKQFINAFGEEVMVANTDKAIALTTKAMHTAISDYTVAPIYLGTERKGGHEWLVEFDQEPDSLGCFAEKLDQTLQQLNGDYEAKRSYDMALECLIIHPLPKGTFARWLASKGKLGGQHKVPRLSNSRKYVDEIMQFANLTGQPR